MSATNFCEYLHTSCTGMMPGRARYVPASSGQGPAAVQMLNGLWRFRQYAGFEVLPAAFFEPEFSDGAWEAVPVPCKRQTEYPAGTDCVYWHTFSYQPETERPKTYLVFEAVDQSFHVWLNGKYLGCGRNAHDISEFDITGVVREGTNTLAVLLPVPEERHEGECPFFQGIYGDVYLLKRPENHIWNYSVSTDVQNGASVRLRLSFAEKRQPVSVKLLNMDGSLAAEQTFRAASEESGRADITLRIGEPRLWDPEDPYLYTLILESGGEQIRTSLAMRAVSVDGSALLLNGVPMKLRGTSESRLTLLRAE